MEGHHEQNGDQERSEQAFRHGGGVVEGGESAGRCGGLRGGVTARVKHRMMSFAQVLALPDGCKCSRPIASNLLVVGKMFPRPPLQSRRTRSWRGIGVGLCATRTSAKRNNGPGRAHGRN